MPIGTVALAKARASVPACSRVGARFHRRGAHEAVGEGRASQSILPEAGPAPLLWRAGAPAKARAAADSHIEFLVPYTPRSKRPCTSYRSAFLVLYAEVPQLKASKTSSMKAHKALFRAPRGKRHVHRAGARHPYIGRAATQALAIGVSDSASPPPSPPSFISQMNSWKLKKAPWTSSSRTTTASIPCRHWYVAWSLSSQTSR